MLLAMLVASCASLSVGGRARAAVPPFWQRLANCETDGRWDWGGGHRNGEGPMFVGGLGIYAPNWEAWQVHVGVVGPAWRATPAEQAEVAAWGFLHARAWWGCFRKIGLPDAEAVAVLRPARSKRPHPPDLLRLGQSFFVTLEGMFGGPAGQSD
jgi:hypothetical protein